MSDGRVPLHETDSQRCHPIQQLLEKATKHIPDVGEDVVCAEPFSKSNAKVQRARA